MTVNGTWYDDLDAVAADAAGALDRIDQPILYDRLDWFRLTRRHIHPHAQLAVARIREGQSAAWLFLVETAPGRAAPLASWYTLRFAPLISGGGVHLLPALYELIGRRFATVGLRPILQRPERMPGWVRFSHRDSTNWSIDLKDRDFSSYWAARPSRLRHTVDRKSRSHPVAIAIHRAFDPGVWADYESVYAESWKPAEGSLPFLRDLAELEAAAGTLRLGIARDPAGRAVAAQFWLVEHGVAVIHKLAHRETAKAGSPGTLLSHAMFRAALEDDGVRRIDFGLGNEPYKAEWMDASVPVWRVDAYRPFSFSGAAGIARELAGHLARRGSHL